MNRRARIVRTIVHRRKWKLIADRRELNRISQESTDRARRRARRPVGAK